MKKYLALALAVLMALACVALVACGDKCANGHTFFEGKCLVCGEADPNYNPGGNEGGNEGGNQGGTTTLKPADTTIADAALKCTNTGSVYATTIGIAGFDTLTGLLDSAGITYTANQALTAADVTANDILIVVVGGSSKGMGGAGVTTSSEVARAQAFAAKEGLEIIVVQLGGDATRGETSDPMYNAICGSADVTLILEAANTDALFTNLCPAGTLYTFSRGSKMVASLKFLLNIA